MNNLKKFAKELSTTLADMIKAGEIKKSSKPKVRTPKQKLKASTAANKAWATRRDRYTDLEISNTQREAAKKAWVTIRKNKAAN